MKTKLLLLTAFLFGCSPQPTIKVGPLLAMEKASFQTVEGIKITGLNNQFVIDNQLGKKPECYGIIQIPISHPVTGDCALTFMVKAEKATYGVCEFNTKKNWSNFIQIEEGTYDWKPFKIVFHSHSSEDVLLILSEGKGKVWVKDLQFSRL